MSRRSATLATVATALGAAAGYYLFVRPRLNTWGASSSESRRQLPGDELAHAKVVQTTHAIDIEADVNTVWPWLLQLGQGRGGFYTYSWLENLVGSQIRNVNEIDRRLQGLSEGDLIRIHPHVSPFLVASLNPPDDIVLVADDVETMARLHFNRLVWSFHLRPHGRGSSRIIARMRGSTDINIGSALASGFIAEPAHYLLERKMLLTIRKLAERAEHAT
jgi:hypothetical protein